MNEIVGKDIVYVYIFQSIFSLFFVGSIGLMGFGLRRFGTTGYKYGTLLCVFLLGSCTTSKGNLVVYMCICKSKLYVYLYLYPYRLYLCRLYVHVHLSTAFLL